MRCKACGYTSKEDFETLIVERKIGDGVFEMSYLFVCPNCGTIKTKTVKEETECPWCKPSSEYTIIDDDFGQPLHPDMIKFCFNCGRDLRKGGKK